MDLGLPLKLTLNEDVMDLEQIELPLDHEPCWDHWAKRIADDDVATGECSNWDHAYESAWDWIEINSWESD